MMMSLEIPSEQKVNKLNRKHEHKHFGFNSKPTGEYTAYLLRGLLDGTNDTMNFAVRIKLMGVEELS